MREKIAIYWFRQDLRLQDNPALMEALKYKRVLVIYILDDYNSGEFKMGAMSRVWLHHSLISLNESLDHFLSVYKGDPQEIFADILSRYVVEGVFWNRCYEPWRIDRDTKIKEVLERKGIEVRTFNGSLLWEPWTIKKANGTPYMVFTPFYQRGCLNAESPRLPTNAALGEMALVPAKAELLFDARGQVGIEGLALLPQVRWDQALTDCWLFGEKGAHSCIKEFLERGLHNYEEGRNLPAKPYVSRLSPYLHFGELSPNQVWHIVRSQSTDCADFCRELGWREFSYSQLYYNRELPRKNLRSKFDAFPWIENSDYLSAWQKGQTGIPMVDAGMRELWQTGYMHGRVRMIVASFLVKNLRLHWHYGERWFWDTLADADLANNSASWQWVAGSGADAAPYFRIFNPVTQGQKYDPEGCYVRQYIPEIAALPNKYLFCPWEAPQSVLDLASVKLGETYAYPLVDLKESRRAALEAYKSLQSIVL